ncbi:hypothetical protein BDA96_07G150000 [Sorghum bicolor]|uniref:Uncharacterized protein n=2 Tax=Sorghum bicolor TaxID=4558 RepID=A0A921QND8_SORBI|nr:hypothetical protein BDA96_07G150000 [Sorghum bicolor]OQU80523.1 hypothetical protein SORBI_3007G139650 [Sorghum bicolor]
MVRSDITNFSSPLLTPDRTSLETLFQSIVVATISSIHEKPNPGSTIINKPKPMKAKRLSLCFSVWSERKVSGPAALCTKSFGR